MRVISTLLLLSLFSTAPLSALFAQKTTMDTTFNTGTKPAVKQDSLNAVKQDSLNIVAEKRPKKSHWQIGLSYISNNQNLGRYDSAELNYYTPSIGYYHKSGLYAQLSTGYLPNAAGSSLDLTTLEIGYALTKGKYDGQLAASRYLYNSQSSNVSAEMKGEIEWTSSFDLGFVSPTYAASLSFSRLVDYGMSFGLEHSFGIIGEALEIDPAFTASASTLNFYDDYYSRRRYTVKRKGKTPVTQKETITGKVENPGQFRILDYEFTAGISYTLHKFNLTVQPAYVIPVHPSSVDITRTLQNGTVITSKKTETLSNTLFWTITATVKFGK